MRPRLRPQIIAAAIATCFAAGVQALPTAPVVAHGTASFAQSGNVLSVTNSNGAIIHWQSFGIGAGETVNFIQPSASSAVLNQVIGAGGAPEMSRIYGTLTSNGRVWLVNPSGILIGPGAVIDTAGFVASTLTVRAEDFLAGRLSFQATPGAGEVINQGEIKTPLGGSVYLVGANVTNEGLIRTPGGETILAAGQTVNLIDTATPGVKVELTGGAGNATNLGQIMAEAGRIGIAGSLVRNSGLLDASSVVEEGGRIFLKASQDTYVDGAGRIVATGTKGGRVEVLGHRVAVMDQAEIDASGKNGGGTILVGGDYQGKNPDVQNAQITYFGPEATLRANATEVGAGGTAIVWADDTTRAYGRIEARGGPNGGNGGIVETSGHQFLDIEGVIVDTRAPLGQVGNWLLDPGSICVYGGATNCGNGYSFYQTDTSLNTSLTTTSVTLQTDSYGSGDIVFSNATISSTAYGLTLYAYGGGSSTGNIVFNNTTLSLGGSLTMYGGWDGGVTSPNVVPDRGDILMASSSITAVGPIYMKAGKNIALDRVTSTTGNVTIDAYRQILDNNGGAVNITANGGANATISLTSQNGSPNNTMLAISTDTAGNFASLTATVSGGTNGDIYIRHQGDAPGSVYMTNSYASYGDIHFRASGNMSAGSNYSFSTNASANSSVFLGADGNLDYQGPSININNVDEIALYAGNTLTVSSSVSAPQVWLGAGSQVIVNAGVTSTSTTLGIAAGLTPALVWSLVGDFNGPPMSLSQFINLPTGLAGNITLNAPVIASQSSVGLMANGNITLNGPAYVEAAQDVYLQLRSPSSRLEFNNPTAVMAPPYIWAKAPSTIYLDFPNLSGGGVYINGVPSLTPINGSGLFFGPNKTPASPGFGLVLTYGASNPIINTVTETVNQSTANDPTIYDELPELETIATLGFDSSDNTIGGGENEFAQTQTSEEREDTRLKKRKFAQCRG
ncbi:MAG: filamentous hemagglutinin N-terminal domain-containing protein [Rhodocyclaceae bacterium]|nr:filamentous hemagglutinin N-terminal domain-containing protein [Rhodocyclaceae bacterium]